VAGHVGEALDSSAVGADGEDPLAAFEVVGGIGALVDDEQDLVADRNRGRDVGGEDQVALVGAIVRAIGDLRDPVATRNGHQSGHQQGASENRGGPALERQQCRAPSPAPDSGRRRTIRREAHHAGFPLTTVPTVWYDRPVPEER